MARKIFFRAALIDLFLDVLLTALINVWQVKKYVSIQKLDLMKPF
jgi:hypothetical protein